MSDAVRRHFDQRSPDFDAIYDSFRHRGPRSRLERWIDRTFRASMRLRFERTLLACQPVQGGRFLDIGCGAGRYAIALAEIGAAEVVGVDASPRMVEAARENAEAHRVADRCRFVVGTFPEVGLEEPFDCSFAMGVLDHVADPEPFLAAVRRLTRRRALVSLPAFEDPLLLQRWLRHRWRGVPLYAYTRGEIERMTSGWRLARPRIERLRRDYLLVIEIAQPLAAAG